MFLIETTSHTSIFAPSHVITGQVVLKQRIKKLIIRLVCYTEDHFGQKTTIYSQEFSHQPNKSTKIPFQFQLPENARLSFDGPLFKIGWKISACAPFERYCEDFNIIVVTGSLAMPKPQFQYSKEIEDITLVSYPKWRFLKPLIKIGWHSDEKERLSLLAWEFIQDTFPIALQAAQYVRTPEQKWQQKVFHEFPLELPSERGVCQWQWYKEWQMSLKSQCHLIRWQLNIQTARELIIPLTY